MRLLNIAYLDIYSMKSILPISATIGKSSLVKNFISKNAPPEVDLVISIYEVVDAQSFPKALCEN